MIRCSIQNQQTHAFDTRKDSKMPSINKGGVDAVLLLGARKHLLLPPKDLRSAPHSASHNRSAQLLAVHRGIASLTYPHCTPPQSP